MNENDLIHLNAWPKGTLGFQQEHVALKQLLFLCTTEGYGRIQQMVEDLVEIWKSPSHLKRCEKNRKKRLASLEWKDGV